MKPNHEEESDTPTFAYDLKTGEVYPAGTYTMLPPGPYFKTVYVDGRGNRSILEEAVKAKRPH